MTVTFWRIDHDTVREKCAHRAIESVGGGGGYGLWRRSCWCVWTYACLDFQLTQYAVNNRSRTRVSIIIRPVRPVWRNYNMRMLFGAGQCDFERIYEMLASLCLFVQWNRVISKLPSAEHSNRISAPLAFLARRINILAACGDGVNWLTILPTSSHCRLGHTHEDAHTLVRTWACVTGNNHTVGSPSFVNFMLSSSNAMHRTLCVCVCIVITCLLYLCGCKSRIEYHHHLRPSTTSPDSSSSAEGVVRLRPSLANSGTHTLTHKSARAGCEII